MKPLILLAMLAALPASAAEPTTQRRTPSPPQWTLEVTSYGEEARDLATLFVPYLAALEFAPSANRLGPGDGVAFFGPNYDVVTIAGRFNCVVIRYHNLLSEKGFFRDEGLAKRADKFRDGVIAFLAGLPEPRPTTKNVDLRSKYCSRPPAPAPLTEANR